MEIKHIFWSYLEKFLVENIQIVNKKFIYSITNKGNHFVDAEKEKLKEVTEKIKQLVQKWNSVSRDKIVEHVYTQSRVNN